MGPWDATEPPALKAAELAAGLEATWGMTVHALARWSPADLGHVFSPPSVLSEAEQRAFGELTSQWIIWHVREHEIHDGGELSLALGALGLAGFYGEVKYISTTFRCSAHPPVGRASSVVDRLSIASLRGFDSLSKSPILGLGPRRHSAVRLMPQASILPMSPQAFRLDE